MARLSSRPDYDTVTAARFMARCSQPHSVEWRARVWQAEDMVADDIPIIGGTLVLDSSDPIRRRLTLEVGGGETFAPKDPTSPLVPFSQRINLWVRIDEADGTGWFPWLKMGEYFIVTQTFERPSYITTVECVDMAGAVDEFLFMGKRSFVDQTIRDAIQTICEEAVPGYVFAVDASDAAEDPDRALKNYVADAGQSRWDACTEIAARRGHECFFNADGNLVIRHDVTDDNDESIPGNGPDIGTVSNPVAVIADGNDGNLVGMTATLSRQGACNGVRINLHSTVPKKVRKAANRPAAAPDWVDAPIHAHVQVLQDTGPVAWGGLFGRVPIVVERDVKDLKGWTVAAIYTPEVLADNPFGYWRCTESTGPTLADSSGNGNDLTINTGSSPTLNQPGPAASTKAVAWPTSAGASDDPYAVTASTTTATQLSLEAWVYLSVHPTADTPFVSCATSYGSAGHDAVGYINSGRHVGYFVSDGSSPTDLVSPGALSLNTWHHVVCTTGPGGSKIRVDKHTVVSDDDATVTSSSAQKIFVHGGGSGYTSGGPVRIAEPALYTSPLSDARADAHYDAMYATSGAETWSHVQTDATHDAKKLLYRRRGLIRYLDLHTLPLYWLEADDRIRIRWHEHEDDDDYQIVNEAHFTARVELDLAGGPMVIRTRQLNVTDPGGGLR